MNESITVAVDSPDVVTVQPTAYEGTVSVEVSNSEQVSVEVAVSGNTTVEVQTPETLDIDVSTLGAPGMMGTKGDTGATGAQGEGFNDDPGDFLLIYENGQV